MRLDKGCFMLCCVLEDNTAKKKKVSHNFTNTLQIQNNICEVTSTTQFSFLA